MRITILSLLFLTAAIPSLFAQETTGRAKIIQESGTVIQAEVELPVSESTPQSFSYRQKSVDAFEKINAESIRSVVFYDGPAYEKFPVSIPVIDRELLKRQKSDYENPANQLKANLMLEKILTGTIHLYLYVDKYGNRHFFYKHRKDSLITYLPANHYMDNGNLKLDASYKNLLSFLGTTSSCEQADIERLEGTDYTLRSMLSAFKKINGCLGTEVDINTTIQRKKDVVKLGVLAGATMYKLTQRNKTGGVSSYKYSTSIKPAAGIFIEVRPGNRNYALDFEFAYQSAHFVSDSFPLWDNAKIEMDYGLISFSPLIKLHFKKLPSFYLATGLQFAYHINSLKKNHKIVSWIGDTRVEEEKINGQMFVGFSVGAGYKITPATSVQLTYNTWPGGSGRVYQCLALTGKLTLF